MKKILVLFKKYEIWLLALLKPLGFWGVGALAVIDAAAIPVPQDLIIAGYIWADKRHFYLYALIAALGSALGGLVPFLLGRAGGEILLMKHVDRQKYEKLRDRFENQEFLAMMIPSMLPPPTPWKLFVLGAGVFEMKVLNFMLSVFTGRLLRYLIISLLTIRYGPEIVKLTINLATEHRVAVLLVLSALIGLLVLWVVRKRRGKSGQFPAEDEASANSRP
ncbi:MAG TPA: VTT domain-containing protein [Acidobacteriaceae bacterium]|nr:VTT domain-containing protein [Acidobacteriaceae bacterium]